MTLENIFSQMGLGAKQLTDRYSEHTGPTHDQQVYYAYEPAAPTHSHVTHVTTSKHSYSGGHKSGAAMSALTLLAFLFFLHILQQCIKDHMTEMNSSPVMVMTAGREGEESVTKNVGSNKIDKTGITQIESNDNIDTMDSIKQQSSFDKYTAINPYTEGALNGKRLMKINAPEYTSKSKDQMFQRVFRNHSSAFPGSISTMDED